VAQAIVGLTKARSIEEYAEAIKGRISALARAHSLLSQSQWRGAPLEELVKDELAPYAKEGQLRIDGAPTVCNADAVQSLSLLFHELATNAVKYGALSCEAGCIAVAWRSAADAFTISWTETGGPEVEAPETTGFGTKLLEQVAARQLQADIDFDWRREGLHVTIDLPTKLFMHDPTKEARSRPHAIDGSDAATDGKAAFKVLLVEDEELIAMELSEELSRLGWHVIGPAATLAEAQALLEDKFDAAILDVNLRGRAVYPVAEALLMRRVPFVFCTGYEMVDPEGRFPDAPVIRKPASAQAVSAALRDLLAAD
jgi:two-component sensor histidine kinase/CheY-like chemotaxis protein